MAVFPLNFFTGISTYCINGMHSNSLSEDIIHSLTGWEYVLDALSL
jgi:hypothetical protein